MMSRRLTQFLLKYNILQKEIICQSLRLEIFGKQRSINQISFFLDKLPRQITTD
jgi:hypothetical protein